MIEAGVPDYEVTTFYGVVAPAGTPADIVARLNAAINEEPSAPEEISEKSRRWAPCPRFCCSGEFSSFMAAQLAKWSAVANKAGVKVD